jgi:hypothetical protein
MFRNIWKRLGLIILILLLPVSLWAAPIGKISHLEGQADITLPDGRTIILKPADSVSVGDILRTKAKSKVEVTFLDGNIIFIAERSRLRISAYDNRENQKNTFDLFRGKTRVVMNNLAKKSTLELQTPTAVAGVRGTTWISTFANGVSEFHFLEGVGYGYSRNLPDVILTIRAGQTMRVLAPSLSPIIRPTHEIKRDLNDTSVTDQKTGGTTSDAIAVGSPPPPPPPLPPPPPPPPPLPPPPPPPLPPPPHVDPYGSY